MTRRLEQLDEKIETLKPQLKGEDQANFNTVRNVTAGVEEDIGPLKQVVKAAQELADPASSPIFKSILKEGETRGGRRGLQRARPAGSQRRSPQGDRGQQGGAVFRPQLRPVYKLQYGEDPPARPAPTSRAVFADGKEVPSSNPNYAHLYETQYGDRRRWMWTVRQPPIFRVCSAGTRI